MLVFQMLPTAYAPVLWGRLQRMVVWTGRQADAVWVAGQEGPPVAGTTAPFPQIQEPGQPGGAGATLGPQAPYR